MAAAKVMVEEISYCISPILEKEPNWIIDCSKEVLNIYFTSLESKALQELNADKIRELEFGDDREKNKKILDKLHILKNRHFTSNGDALKHLTADQVFTAFRTETFSSVIAGYLTAKQLSEVDFEKLDCESEAIKNILSSLFASHCSEEKIQSIMPKSLMTVLPFIDRYVVEKILPIQIQTADAANYLVKTHLSKTKLILRNNPDWETHVPKEVKNIFDSLT